jgi:pimeloyl-ACP methyl ester carboxylesterase
VARGEVPEDPASWSKELVALGSRLTDKAKVAEYVVLQRPGFWYAEVLPGCYGVGAFADLDQDFKYDDEPVAAASVRPERLFRLEAGDRQEGIDLLIRSDARLGETFDPVALLIKEKGVRGHDEQLLVSISAVAVEGEVVDLKDPRFSAKNGKLGYFEVYRFLWDAKPGIYFLEPYDPDRIPVVFVHGALGYPQEFTTLIENLDQTRFQPWVFFYPSGARLGPVADFMSQSLSRLQLRHGFEELAVVAHSMGGIVSRDFVFRYHDQVADNPLEVFVSISTPWGGVPSAESGVSKSPFVVPSWRDIGPESEFLSKLFFEDPAERTQRRELPEEVDFYLLFGVEDETIPVPSAIRWEAQRDAKRRWALAYDHTGILRSPEASKLLNEILEQEFH